MPKLDPFSLKLFVSVVTEKSIAAAAAKHHITAAAVSKRINDLEDSLNSTLLLRTNRGVEATDAGSTLSALAQTALNELERIPRLMENACAGGQGIVRVCGSPSAVSQFLMDDLLAFIQSNPNIQLHADECTSDTVLQSVRDNAVDIGVYTNAHASEGFCTAPYRTDRLVLICPPGHPLSERESWRFEQTLEHNFIGWYSGSAINKQLNTAALMSQSLWRVRMRVSSFDALCKMVSNGVGIGILPEEVAHQRSKVFDLKICQIENDWSLRHFKLAYRDKGAMSAPAKLLLSFLTERAAAETATAIAK